MLLDELLSRLDGVKRSGEAGFVARCPAHEDHRQSLSVGMGDDGRLLVTCFAGCDTEAVCGALGVALADLFPEKQNGNGQRKIVATYDYVDESGELLFQVVRFTPKDFRQRKPNGSGGWEWKLAGTRRVLYRLPQVLAAIAGGELVYVVEGEKDADALAELGLTATCNAAGAGKWRDEYTTALSGAKVVIVADKDEPGRKHAFAVAASLAGRAADISIVEAVEGKDASDHLDAGYTTSEFVACRGGQDAAPATTLPAVTLADLMASAPERPEYVLFGYVARGAITEVAAKPKVGKTRFVMEAVARILAGEEYIGHATFACRVLYMTEESRGSFVAGAKRSGINARGDSCHVLMRGSVRSLAWDQIGELVLAYCEQHHIDLVVTDTLSDWAGLRGDDENSAGAALAAMAPLRALADSGRAVIAIRHERKGTGDIGESARGSSAFGGAMDILVSLRRTRGRGHDNRRELHAVGRFDETPGAVTIELEEGGYRVVMENAEGRRREVELQILEVLPMGEQWALSESDLRERLEIDHTVARRALQDLTKRGVISVGKRARSDGHGQVAVYWREEAK
jgi:5S rRNA maturation endonuclease (ribonuclease M5)